MAGTVKKRAYDSPRRREQADATRAAILDAALKLFQQQGYGATSVAAIAEEAGVALKTVYAVFGTKRGVLIALRSRLVRGSDDPVPVAEREWFRAVLDEPNPRKRLSMFAQAATVLKGRAGPIFEIIRHAAPTDPEIGAMWNEFMRDFYENQRLVIERFATDGILKVDVDRATDILWTINHPAVYHLLVAERGWSADAYQRWLEESLSQQLLTSIRRPNRKEEADR
jgi:AcrR family transcriptional regulator